MTANKPASIRAHLDAITVTYAETLLANLPARLKAEAGEVVVAAPGIVGLHVRGFTKTDLPFSLDIAFFWEVRYELCQLRASADVTVPGQRCLGISGCVGMNENLEEHAKGWRALDDY